MHTYTDAITGIVRALRGHGLVASIDVVKAGVRAGLHNFFLASHWTRYKTETAIHAEASVSAGTVDYNASTRTATISGAVFPSWAPGCTLVIQGAYGRVDDVLDSTHAVLAFGPSEDKTGARYALYRDRIELPHGAVTLMSVHTSFYQSMRTVSAEWIHLQAATALTCGIPQVAAMESMNDRRYMRVWPLPAQAITYYLIYRRSPVELRYTGRDEPDYAGTVTVSGDTVTGSGTAFHPGMTGLVFRLSRNTELPTGLDGNNPYVAESIVRSVSSGTGMALRDAIGNFPTASKYCVASLLDVDDYAYNALLGFAMLETARLIGAQIDVDIGADLDAAMAADAAQAPGAIQGTSRTQNIRYIYPVIRG